MNNPTNSFYTNTNLKLIVNIFKDYMSEKYEFSIEDEASARKVIYELMSKIDEECKTSPMPLQNMNIRVLNIAKDIYVKKFELNDRSNKPNIQNLSRDKSVFGSRQMNTTMMMPEMDPYTRRNLEPKEALNITERMIAERDREIGIEKKSLPTVEAVIKPKIEKAENADNFMQRLKELESERNFVIDDLETRRPKLTQQDQEQQSMQQSIVLDRIQVSKQMNDTNNLQNHDPKVIMSKIQNNETPINYNNNIYSRFTEGKELTVIPKNLQSKIVEKYLSINSFDREWLIEPTRYSYSINFTTKSNSIQNRYRNIESIAVGSVIIPDEIVQTKDPIKPSFNNDFTFSYPYLLLRIDEFSDVYDGTNDIVRRAFCKLAFHKAYKGQNGRGYVVLRPVQNEKKTFYPAPLSALNKFTISILRPNGGLFNNSTDSYSLASVEYDSSKPNYIKLTLDGYFDQNEFFYGDIIQFQNYIMTKLSPIQQDIDIKTFNEYMNRTEGFEIQDLGDPNSNGYYNIVYIEAPGSFNKSLGQYQVNMNLINCLNTYNSSLSSSNVNGNVMNSSLQHSISMKVNMIVDDAKVLDAQSHFNF